VKENVNKVQRKNFKETNQHQNYNITALAVNDVAGCASYIFVIK